VKETGKLWHVLYINRHTLHMCVWVYNAGRRIGCQQKRTADARPQRGAKERGSEVMMKEEEGESSLHRVRFTT